MDVFLLKKIFEKEENVDQWHKFSINDCIIKVQTIKDLT